MPRTARVAPGGTVFHVLNPGAGKMRLFLKDADFEAFQRTIVRLLESRPMRICGCSASGPWPIRETGPIWSTGRKRRRRWKPSGAA